jgi:hypothetical protein
MYRVCNQMFESNLTALAQSMVEGASENLDEPITSQDRVNLTRTFLLAHGFSLTPHDLPSDSLLGRCFRESRARTTRLVNLTKVRSLFDTQLRTGPKRQRLNNEMHLIMNKNSDPTEEPISGDLDYLHRATVYINALLMTGLVETGDPPTRWFPLQVGMDYLSILRAGVRNVSLRQCMFADDAVRKRVVAMVRNQSLTLGSAFTAAHLEIAHMFNLPTMVPHTDIRPNPPVTRAPRPASLAPLAHPRPKGAPKRAAAKARGTPQIEDFGRPTVQRFADGTSPCKRFNDRRGCTRADCNRSHKCDIDMGGGVGCGASHARHRHPH